MWKSHSEKTKGVLECASYPVFTTEDAESAENGIRIPAFFFTYVR